MIIFMSARAAPINHAIDKPCHAVCVSCKGRGGWMRAARLTGPGGQGCQPRSVQNKVSSQVGARGRMDKK